MKKLTKLGKFTQIAAFVFIFGTTGALELNDISMTQGLIQYAIGLVATAIGLKLTYAK